MVEMYKSMHGMEYVECKSEKLFTVFNNTRTREHPMIASRVRRERERISPPSMQLICGLKYVVMARIVDSFTLIAVRSSKGD